MFRPTFGQTANTSGFGSFTASNPNPFGQTSVFGKTQTTGFAQPTFGTSGSTGLFGNTLSSSSSLFGSTTTPTFGQAQTTQGFGFGATTQPPATNLFGAQQNAGTGLFSSGSSAFGASKPAFGSTFGTGTTTNLFGSQQPAQTATPLFGQTTPSTGTGLFGSSGGTFGGTTPTSGSTIKFNPVTGTDTMIKNGVSQTINTRMFCITCMKEYENKSLEEIRYEDYLANRKGPQQNSVFGAPAQQSSIFGTSAATPNLFGAQPPENKPLFGGTSTSLGGFGATTGGVFGSTSTAGNSLFNKTAPFGTTTTTSNFGFGTPSTNTLFGSQNKPFGTTTQTAGGMFGQPTTQASTGFGTQAGGFAGFGSQPNQSIGLFNQNKPATNFNLGTTTTSGFSFGTNTSTNSNMFGAKPATSGFGAPVSNTGFGSFGTNTFGTSTANTSSLFKPTTTNFGFGAPQTSTGLGGSTLGTGNSLFGNTAQKPGGLFGNTTGNSMFGGSTFGAGSNTAGGGLSLGGTSLGGGSLFGNTSMMPAQPASFQAHPAILALSSVPFADSALFKNLLPASGKTDSLIKQNNAVTQKAMLACKDLKVSPKNSVKIKLRPLSTPLTKKALFEGLEESDVMSPSIATASNVKKLSLKPKLYNNHSVSDSWVENNSNKENEIEKTPRRVSFTIPLESSKDRDDKGSFYIRRNPLFRPQRHSTLVDLEQTTVVCSSTEKDTEPNANTPEGNKSTSSANANTSQLDDTPNRDTSRQSTSLDETRGYLSDTSRYDDDWQPHPSGIILKRVDYYTIPSLDDLEHLVAEDGSCIVDNFCVGRINYGNLFFDETMDVAGLNIDEIVHFRHKEVNVYPDDEKKPPVGTGLNRKCQVTLEQVWPVDKTTREPIKDPERLLTMKYEEKLRRSTAKMGATFMEYRPLTGSWVFKVDHFSKYGLSDSDDEEDDKLPVQKPPAVSAKQIITKPTQTPPPPPLGSKTASSTVLSPILPTKQLCTSLDSRTFTVAGPKDKTYSAGDLGLDIDEDMDEEDGNDGDDLLDSLDTTGGEHLSPSIHLAHRVGIDSHKVQLMKASLFEKEADEFGELGKLDAMTYMDYPMLDEMQGDQLDLKLPRGLHTLRAKFKQAPKTVSAPFDLRGLEFKPETIPMERFAQIPTVLRAPRPKTVNLTHCGSVLPYYKSTVAKLNARCLADIGVYMGRSFRTGWGPRTVITNLSTLCRSEYGNGDVNFCLDGRTSNDSSPNVLQTLMIYNKNMPDHFKDSIEGHLIIQLKHSTKGEEDGCPILAPQSGVDALHAHCTFACNEPEPISDFSAYCKQVWELCVALWGNLPTLSVEDDPSSHKTIMMRKEAVTQWLRKCANASVRNEVNKHLNDFKNQDRYVSAVLALLSGREIEEACCTLQKNGDHFAAMLLASGPTSKPLLQDQLSEWQNVNADAYIDPERLRLFCISSGIPLYSSSQGLVNICENLDWKRTFALHFWYLLSPVSSVADIINKYEAAFENSEPYACRPSPPYSEEVTTTKGKHIHDLCYHLLKLYCFKSHPLEQILNPATYSPDPLDYRLSWLLEKVLASLGYVHLSELSSSITCVSFASQLEAHGLWHWAIFVYLHIVDNFRRKQAVIEMIGRHVVLTEDRELTNEEEFVVDELNVPPEWIFRAKATRALSEFRYHDATFYLTQAREWNEAHQVIIEHIAADEIINENYDYLRDLLKSLAPNYTSISEWYHLGQLLWDYLEVIRIVEQALAERDIYELESRQSQISSLCSRILRWPCKTAKDRLCQAEISKRTAHIFHNVMQLGERMSMSEVMDVVSKLPLPEDYLSEELRHIKESFTET